MKCKINRSYKFQCVEHYVAQCPIVTFAKKRLEGKVMSTCLTPICLYGTETLAMTELQQQRLQMCENNWVRKIARVTRADKSRMVELREETGVQRSLTGRLVRSRLQWAGHVGRMADGGWRMADD